MLGIGVFVGLRNLVAVPPGRHFVGVASKGGDALGGEHLEAAADEEAHDHQDRRGVRCGEVVGLKDTGFLTAVREDHCTGWDERVVDSEHRKLWVTLVGIGAGGVVHEANTSVDAVANICTGGGACRVDSCLLADGKIITKIISVLFRS